MQAANGPTFVAGASPWIRQISAVARLELHRHWLAPRGFWVLLLAFSPALIAGLHFIQAHYRTGSCSIERDSVLFAGIFQLYSLRLALFFGCLSGFIGLFRGLSVDKTLQYYLVAPLRREVLLVGKYLVESIGTATAFAMGNAAAFMLTCWHRGSSAAAFLAPDRAVGDLFAYLGVTLLASLGYSAVFLGLGLLFKNPVLSAVVYFGWESVSGMLPSALQRLSVTFYLKPLFPVEFPVIGISGLFTVVPEPVPVWQCVASLLLLCALVVTLGALRIRHAEIEPLE